MSEYRELTEAIVRGDHEAAVRLAAAALEAGADPERLVFDDLTPAMDHVGRRFEDREIFLPELLVAARAMKAAMETVQPALAGRNSRTLGVVVLGTVAGDVHDIGKRLVGAMLEGSGFRVVDLGIDVPIDAFVSAVRQENADIVGLSGLLSSTLPQMGRVIDALQKSGLRESVRVMVGGAPVNQRFAAQIGADGYAPDAGAAVNVARTLLNGGPVPCANPGPEPAEQTDSRSAPAMTRTVKIKKTSDDMTSRELVRRTLAFDAPPRVPRQLWVLPWAEFHHPREVADLQREFPDDIVSSPSFYRTPLPTRGQRYEIGTYVDEWGCTFENLQRGVIGEVKRPQLSTWDRLDSVRLPEERLTLDVEQVNAFCRATGQFVISGVFPRPFERLQFIRGSENLYLDLVDQPPELAALLDRMHRFYLKELALWARTEVDALMIMDDWGSQQAMLVSPDLWRRMFRPLYRDYIEIAHAAGKPMFMHSDGYIADILPDLVELGLDAINSQVHCMDVGLLGARFGGKITFWGEMDRQHILPSGSTEEVAAAAEQMRRAFWRDGGLIAQCEFGPSARPENIRTYLEVFANE